MSKKKTALDSAKSTLVYEVDPTECPFREFRDQELMPELWGLGPAICRATILAGVKGAKLNTDLVWLDHQAQPLPRSVRRYLHGWVRAEVLAEDRWDADVLVFEENAGNSKMSVIDMQLTHAQVLMRSSFCRMVLSACYILEKAEGLTMEHQGEHFMCSFPPEGWRARCHIYSPGTKYGGGYQHRPGLSKNGCYLVRLFYLGAWRCVWVSDQIPVDATGAPLLPFSPLIFSAPKLADKTRSSFVISNVVYLWPLLICKALLKLAAPDMTCDEDSDCVEDEKMKHLDVIYALTGCMPFYHYNNGPEELWKLFLSEVTVFGWDDDDETYMSVKTKSTKKPTNKEAPISRTHTSLTTIFIEDTKDVPSYIIPGIAPGHAMTLIVKMARDLPLKKPLPEPDVALWKYYRWVDWAKRHGLYTDYECPRTKFLKVNGLMKMSYTPHLLDVTSTESIVYGFREQHGKTGPGPPTTKKGVSKDQGSNTSFANQSKDELREWIRYDQLYSLIKKTTVVYFPSLYTFTSAASNPVVRLSKGPVVNRSVDITAPKFEPLYIQIDGPEENILRISLTTIHPRVMMNSNIAMTDYVEPAYLILEHFDWFDDVKLPVAKAFIETRGYDSVEVKFIPGRHFCRLWVHSPMRWYIMLLSDSALVMSTRDVVQAASYRECGWTDIFLTNLSTAFSNWIRSGKSSTAITTSDSDFFRSYAPDLTWDSEKIGYSQSFLHWMFRQALQSFLFKKLPVLEYRSVCSVLRHFFCDPYFGLPPIPEPSSCFKKIGAIDICDCPLPEMEEMGEEALEEELEFQGEDKHSLDQDLVDKLFTPATQPYVSRICELASEDQPCGVIREHKEKIIRKHEAATILQSHWRGTWARKCLNDKVNVSPDFMKLIMDNAFGNLEALSALMREFFMLFPRTRSAYSVASALGGFNGLFQHQGATTATPTCKWIPYFQGVFFCHDQVKVHFTVQSNIEHSTVLVYNNDTGEQLPQVYNAHITFDISPNRFGYTVMGHGTLSTPKNVKFEVVWHLTVLSSADGAFHVCDNDAGECTQIPLQISHKMHVNEMFIPNKKNILGALQITVTDCEAISFRAASNSEELELVATLRSTTPKGDITEIAKCNGRGEIHWPYIWLQPFQDRESIQSAKLKAKLTKQSSSPLLSKRLSKVPKNKTKTRSLMKLKSNASMPRQYTIEVTASHGWPLTIAQWNRVVETWNSPSIPEQKTSPKKVVTKGSAKEKDQIDNADTYIPKPDDAYIELECSLAIGGTVIAKRDDRRIQEFAAIRKEWDSKPGRSAKCAQARREFRDEYIRVFVAPPSTTSVPSNDFEEMIMESEAISDKRHLSLDQKMTPASESGVNEISIETTEEAKYLELPDELRDKFIELSFIPECTKEITEEVTIISNDMSEANKQGVLARIKAGQERVLELNNYNKNYVLQRQIERSNMLDSLMIGGDWCPDIAEALLKRDDSIAQETLMRIQSANKKKQDLKGHK